MLRCLDWSAWYNVMPGADRELLHVSGSCDVESASTEIRLEPDNEGIVDDPSLFVLRLVVEEGRFGDTMVATKEVAGTWREAAVERVVVRLPDGNDASIDVREAH